MGGTALNQTQRISKDEYTSIVALICNTLREADVINIYPLKSIDEKHDFGDIDILISNEYKPILYSKINELFNIKESSDFKIVKNSNVCSFLFNNAQIDLISIDWEFLPITSVFYDYNDLGNLIGRLCKYTKCKFTPRGLYFDVYSEKRDKKLKEIFICDEIESIFKFIDLDYNVYKKGFSTYEEAFDFVLSSKYFNTKYYNSIEYINSKTRSRDIKRKSFIKFLDHIKDKEILNPIKLDLNQSLLKINEHFPNIKINELYAQTKYNEIINIKNKKHYNGNFVNEVTGLYGKELGEFMSYFKRNYIDKLNKDLYKVSKNILRLSIYFYFIKYKLKL